MNLALLLLLPERYLQLRNLPHLPQAPFVQSLEGQRTRQSQMSMFQRKQQQTYQRRQRHKNLNRTFAPLFRVAVITLLGGIEPKSAFFIVVLVIDIGIHQSW